MPRIIYIVTVPSMVQQFLAERMLFLADSYEVAAVCSPGAEHGEFRKQGLVTHAIPIARHISLWQDLKSLWTLYRFLRRERPDVVHSMSPKGGLLGMMAAFFAGVPVRIHTFTGLIFPWKRGAVRSLLRVMDALTCLFATVVNPEGEGVRRQLQEGGVTRKPLHIVANGNLNGVDLTRFMPGKGREEKRRELGIAEGEVVFCFVGRLVVDKGVCELVEAFCRLHHGGVSCRLILVGREEGELDPLPEEIRRRIVSHSAITCTGLRSDVEAWLAASDIFVLPSHREGFCNVLLEAGAMALPRITYDICGCNDSVDAQTGILLPPHDHEALYEAMLRLAEDPAARASLGQAARRTIEERFDRRYVWQELKKFYSGILS